MPLAAAVGTVVHDAAAACVAALRHGRALPSFDVLYAAAARRLNQMWVVSHRARDVYLDRPSRLAVPMLQEVLLGDSPHREALARTRAKLERVLRRLLGVDAVWREVAHATRKVPAALWEPQPMYRFMLEPEGVPIYAAPDLLYRVDGDDHAGRRTLVITDWKTGVADGVVDQVLTYALAVRIGMRLHAESDVFRGQVVALNATAEEDVTASFVIDEEDVRATVTRLQANIAAMRAFQRDATRNAPHPMEAFPQTRDTRRCRGCGFRPLCWPDMYRLPAR